MYLVIKDSDNIKDHYKIKDLISKNIDHEEKENFWYKFGLEQYWTGYCWSSGTIDNIKDIDEYLTKKFKELQEKSWNEIIEIYVEDKFGYTVVNHLSDINWKKEPDKNIEPVR